MALLLKRVLIINPPSQHHLKTKDILIKDGIITHIKDTITDAAEIIVDNQNLVVCPGFIDCFSHFNEPGFEYKETLASGALSAAFGGYTKVFVLPNTKPVIQNKAQVSYIKEKSNQLHIDIEPLGAVSTYTEGKQLAEMYDMFNNGAIAFTDGLQPIQNTELLLKALQYVKAFDGIVIQMPVNNSISQHGLMNEGISSVQLGLQGLPSIAEEMMITRDIELLKYTQSKLHITGVSTKNGINLIAKAKQDGLNITCSVSPDYLFFCDEDLADYDTNLKLNPPLRTKEDKAALQQALKNGIIDCIASHHNPQDWDNKTCEFMQAAFGSINLQTAFSVVNTAIQELSNERIAEIFSSTPANIFRIQQPVIEEGQAANCTVFSRDGLFTLTKENNQSKSCNTAFLNKPLHGKIIGVHCKGNWIAAED